MEWGIASKLIVTAAAIAALAALFVGWVVAMNRAWFVHSDRDGAGEP